MPRAEIALQRRAAGLGDSPHHAVGADRDDAVDLRQRDLDRVDFPTLRRRLSQNGAQEKLTKQWIDRCLRHLGWREAAAAE